MRNNILFIGTPFMNIYQDVIEEFHKQGYEVDFIAEQNHPEDPDNVRGSNFESPDEFLAKNTKYWTDLLNSKTYNKVYDILFVLDGQSIAPCVFSILRERNSQLYAVNYLFDTTKGVYRFDKNFQYFDKVATFDIEESKKYGIDLLPIYWKPTTNEQEKKYLFFGVGRYNKARGKLYTLLYKESKRIGRPSLVKFQGERIALYPIKYLIRRAIGSKRVDIPLSIYYSDMFLEKPFSLDEFRALTLQSEIVIDTNAPHQDGLTARFMWALGLGQKIITTNKAVRQYAFYNEQQIYVVEDYNNFIHTSEFKTFIDAPFNNVNNRLEVDKYRIDNWVKTLLNNQ